MIILALPFILILSAVPALAQLPPPAYARPSQIVFIPQVRFLDTRTGTATCEAESAPGAPIAIGPFHDAEERDFMIADCWSANEDGVITIPPTAIGLVLNITAVNPTGKGYLLAYDALAQRPTTSTLNFTPGQNRNSLTIVALGQYVGQAIGVPFWPDLAIFTKVSGGGTVDVIVDVLGYLVPAQEAP